MFATLTMALAYIVIPGLIVIGVFLLTSREGLVATHRPISSVFRRIGLPLPVVAIVSMLIAIGIANGPTGNAETVFGRVVASQPSKHGFTLTLFFSDGDKTTVDSARVFPIQSQIECNRQRARFSGGYVYKCLTPS